MQPILYCAGPYRAATRIAIKANITRARNVGIEAARRGWMPLVPHCNTAHMEIDLPHVGDDFWLRGTMEIMERCDALVLVDGWEHSAGTLGEIARADELHIPVFRGLHLLPSASEFITWLYAIEDRRA